MASAAGKDSGTMLAVKAPLDALDDMIRDADLDVILANRNSPNQGVLSGSVKAIEHALKVCKQKKFRGIRLPVAAAFHSKLVKDAQKPFMETLQKVSIVPSDIPVFSNTTGEAYPSDPDKAKTLLGGQILCPVNFVSEIENLYDSGVRTFLEVGPKSVLTGLVKAILKGREFHALSLDSSSGKKFGMADLAGTLSELASLGYPVDLDKWEHPEKPKKQRMSIPISGANYRAESKPKPPKPEGPDSSGSSGDSDDSSNSPVSSGGSDNGSDGSKQKAMNYQQKQALPEKRIPENATVAFNNKQEVSPRTPNPGLRSQPSERSLVENRKNMDKNNQKQFLTNQNQTSDDHHHGHVRACIVTDALKAVQEGMKSMQTLQMHTAETHKKFLETQTEASRTLQMMMENTRHLAEVSMGMNVPDYSFPAPARVTAPAPPGSQPANPGCGRKNTKQG